MWIGLFVLVCFGSNATAFVVCPYLFTCKHEVFQRRSMTSTPDPADQFRGTDRFERWRFLQGLLDNECPADEVNRILFLVLDGALKYPRPKYEETEETGSPEITAGLRARIDLLLAASIDGRIPIFEGPDCSSGSDSLLKALNDVLPDPDEDEDASKSLWNTVMELHGREMVKVNEASATPEWKALCSTARVLLHFDFLMLGIVEEPLF
jgi:hypothetical protein